MSLAVTSSYRYDETAVDLLEPPVRLENRVERPTCCRVQGAAGFVAPVAYVSEVELDRPACRNQPGDCDVADLMES